MEFFELTYKGNNSHLFSDEAWMMISEFSQMLKGRTSIGEGSMWFDTDKVVSPPCISLCRDMYLSTIHVPRNFNKIGQFLYNYHYFALRPMIKSDFVYYMGQVWNLSEIERLPYYKSRQMLISMDRNITKYINSNALNRVWSILLLRGSIGGSAGMMDRFFQNNLSQCVYDCFKITSALKIYKLKTGMYPTHLEELAPNILKQIPLNPFSGEEYTYKPQKRGFLLHPEYNSLIDYLGIDRSKILSEYLLWRCPN